MDARLQDTIERLMRQDDFPRVLEYIRERRQQYTEYIINYDATDVGIIARTQGQIMALDEVLRIPDEASSLKQQRTN